jgi:5-methylcytosine-specific restriction endonuclease McrA
MKPRAAHTRALYRRNAWKTLARQVVREESTCWLRLPGCTTRATTADHIIPVSERPDLFLVRANCRGACRSCNTARHSLPVSALPALRRAHRQRPAALALFGSNTCARSEPANGQPRSG